jgi:tight adherence protein C
VIAALLAFLAAASAAAGLALLAPEPRVSRPASPGTRALRLLAAAGGRLRVGRPGAGRPAVARFTTGPVDLAARIEAAGRPAGLGVRELTAAKLAGAVLAGVSGAAAGSLAPGRLGFVLTLAAPVAGFLAPDLWLRRLASERARLVRRELPGLLDLLRVTVEAGSSLGDALRSVGERAAGPLAAELRATGREAALGVPLADALEGLCRRVPLPEVRALAAALERARRHGAPLAETLTAQARDARFALARRIREEAARAGPKIQLVVALLLVPSVLLLVAAALASALLGGEGEVVPV